VYNSADIVGETLDRVARACEGEGWIAEVIAVDDGSTDGSRDVLRDSAARHPQVRIIELGRNVGQHAALLVGLRAARGAVVVCLDDDLQHPPEAIPRLVRKLDDGHDVVFARFATPKHAAWRRPGSALVRAMDRYLFGAPRGLSVSSFRAMRREVADRVCAYQGTTPYVRGQMLLASAAPANVDVEHQLRAGGRSSYSSLALVALVLRVLLEWSRIPAWLAVVGGFALTGAAAGLAGGSTALALALGVPGVSLVVSGAWLVVRRSGTRHL
jgi:glycosyltransferase involved in cell wall biosynthesis